MYLYYRTDDYILFEILNENKFIKNMSYYKAPANNSIIRLWEKMKFPQPRKNGRKSVEKQTSPPQKKNS